MCVCVCVCILSYIYMCVYIYIYIYMYMCVYIYIYIISSVMHAFWLVLTYDLLEDRHIDDVIIKTFSNSLLYKTNRFQVAVCLFSNRSRRTLKCGKNISDTLGCAFCATFLFLPHLTSSAIYYWTDARQLGIYLLNIYTYIYIYYYYYHLYYFEFALVCSKGRGQNNTISLGRKCIQGEAILDPLSTIIADWRALLMFYLYSGSLLCI